MSALVRIVAGAIWIATTAAADNINVSKIATGTSQSINFSTAAMKPFLANVYDLSYHTKALGGISSESSDYYLPTPWADTWQDSKAYPKLQREEPTPADTDDQEYASPFWKLALADMTVSPRLVQSRVFKSGSAETVTTYSMKVEHFGSPGDYFLTVHVPTFQMSFATAYSLCCPGDYNGGTYLYKKPNKIRMRAAVDLYSTICPPGRPKRHIPMPKISATTRPTTSTLFGIELHRQGPTLFISAASMLVTRSSFPGSFERMLFRTLPIAEMLTSEPVIRRRNAAPIPAQRSRLPEARFPASVFTPRPPRFVRTRP